MFSFRSLFAPSVFGLLVSSALANVDWLSSMEAGRAAATERQRPLYLHIGDPLNELTGAMERQTFANAEVAAFLNEHFVCVRLDRDAAPGLAGYGQQWLAADQKLPGWPLNLWFTPDLSPIEGASYLPPTEEWGREGFMVVAGRVAERWGTDAESVGRNAANTAALIANYLPFAAEPPADLDAALAQASDDWLALLDTAQGTFGDAPHSLEPELIRFLLVRGGPAREAALASLEARLLSPLRDPLDGGFYRATADSKGSIPVFQKRLTDQARIALACLDAAAANDNPLFAAGAVSALDYAINRLADSASGAYFVGEDATAPGAVATQTWTWAELTDLTDSETARLLAAQPDGNVDPAEDLEGHHQGRNILRASPLTASAPFEKLLTVRSERATTLVRQLAPAGAQALLLHALRRSHDELDNQAHGAAAERLQSTLTDRFGLGTDTFSRIAGEPVPATPEDYVLAALALDDHALAARADELFYDDELGLYTVTTDEVLGIRPLWWKTGTGELPSPMVWRVLLGGAPELMAQELTLPFENPDAPPAGATLLALQQTLR